MYIEQEPYIRELVESYMNNRFKNVLDILDRYSVSLECSPRHHTSTN